MQSDAPHYLPCKADLHGRMCSTTPYELHKTPPWSLSAVPLPVHRLVLLLLLELLLLLLQRRLEQVVLLPLHPQHACHLQAKEQFKCSAWVLHAFERTLTPSRCGGRPRFLRRAARQNHQAQSHG